MQPKWKSGVYLITNIMNGKVYVGSSIVSVACRIKSHKRLLDDSKHVNNHLQHAWNKYGSRAFQFSTLMTCSPKDCTRNEQAFIDRLKSCDSRYGYNIRLGANNGLHSNETKLKIGAGNKGKKRTDEQRKRLSEAHKGYKPSTEHRKRLSQSRIGRKASAETCKKISAALTGKTLSTETRAKIASSLRGRKVPPEIAKRRAEGNRGKKRSPRSDDWCKKLSEAGKGKKQSAETVAKRQSAIRAKRQRFQILQDDDLV